jgi:hypothetical protein
MSTRKLSNITEISQSSIFRRFWEEIWSFIPTKCKFRRWLNQVIMLKDYILLRNSSGIVLTWLEISGLVMRHISHSVDK